MPAVVEAALIEIRAKFRKARAQLVGIDAPSADFAEARRIDDVPDAGNGHELRGGRGVLPGAPFLADRADAQLEPRLEGVEQTRLPRARRTCEDRVAAAQQVAQRGEALIRLHRRSQQLIAGGLEPAGQSLFARAVELDLVEDHGCRKAIRFRNDEETIDHPGTWLRIPGGGHDDHLVDVRRDRLSAPRTGAAAALRRAPRQHRPAWTDLGDRRSLKDNDVARDHAARVLVFQLAAE